MNASEVMDQILDHAKLNQCGDAIAVPHNLSWAPQGDINIFRLSGVPKNATPQPKNAQLAPGTSRGSRHCIKAEDLSACNFFALRSPNPLQGPIIESTKPITITHPEHGDQTWGPGVLAITYQRRYAEELKRIAD